MSQLLIPGPNNELITSSYVPIAYPSADSGLTVSFLNSDTSLSKPTNNTSTAIYIVDAWDGMVSVTLPPSDGNTQFLFKKVDGSANPVRIYGSGSNTVDGSSYQSLSSQWASIRVISYDSASWYKF